MLRSIFSKNRHSSTDKLYLACDIGGTKSRFAIARVGATAQLLATFEMPSSKIENFRDTVRTVLERFEKEQNLTPMHAGIAVAGAVSLDRTHVKPTNLPFTINANDIVQNTPLEGVVLLNDFEAPGFGITQLGKDEVKCVLGCALPEDKINPTRAIIGAGTGLGKGILAWDGEHGQYVSLPSEGGHGDFAIHNEQDAALVQFLYDTIGLDKTFPIEWEDILSGRGISRIYQWLHTASSRASEIHTKIQAAHFDPKAIAAYRQTDELARKTFSCFAAFYGRFAKNVALGALARGCIYLAGGTAIQIDDIFLQG